MQMVVIEEFSMLSASFLEMLDKVARMMKGSSVPFGGIRIMLVGDVAQLPPVGEFSCELDDAGVQHVRRQPFQYAFQSSVWPTLGFQNFKLSHCWRYDLKSELGKFLTALRVAGKMTAVLFQACTRLLQNKQVESSAAVTLCCTNDIARKASEGQLSRLTGTQYDYYAVDRHGSNKFVNTATSTANNGGAGGPTYRDEQNNERPLFSSMSEAALVPLKEGAQVLCTCKLHDKVRAGCLGKVIGFDDNTTAADVTDPRDLGYNGMQSRSKMTCLMCNRMAVGLKYASQE